MKKIPDIELSLATDQICYIIVRSREFEVKELPSGLTQGSNESDDDMMQVLESRRSDPVFRELRTFINDLNDDQQTDLVALAWVGRGDFDFDEWDEAREMAADSRSGPTSDYLLGMPLLPDYLEDALSDLDRSCEGEELGRL
ncbi:MAG: DUF3775 domain-containing protein [Alphaproteobacteria bacterium]|nr:DUF3775 domain-containing protein [Alphaproteobacteria bacterium]